MGGGGAIGEMGCGLVWPLVGEEEDIGDASCLCGLVGADGMG